MKNCSASGLISDPGAELPCPDVGAQLHPVVLEELDRAEEGRGEDCTDTEDLVALDEAAEELAVHALLAVGAEDGRVRAGVDVVLVEGSVSEVGALVVAGEDWPCREAGSRGDLWLDEVEVHSFPLV